VSAKPAEKITTPPTRRAAQPFIASSTAARGIARTAQSTPSGRSAVDFRQGRPLISARLGLIRWISPEKPKRSRFARTLPPSEPGVGEAPAMAIERGRNMRAIAAWVELDTGREPLRGWKTVDGFIAARLQPTRPWSAIPGAWE